VKGLDDGRWGSFASIVCIISRYGELIEGFTSDTVLSGSHISYIWAVFVQLCSFSALSRSYRRIAPSKVCAPLPQSSGEQYSAGLWEIPSLHGTKILGSISISVRVS
jgi:hypothetical protein